MECTEQEQEINQIPIGQKAWLNYAANIDVSVYRPLETLEIKLGRSPNVKELAEYIVQIRSAEAYAMMSCLYGKSNAT